MTNKPERVDLYKFLTPAILSSMFLFLSLYLCVLETSIYQYVLPLFGVSLIISLLFFLQTDKKLKSSIKEMEDKQEFYKFYQRFEGLIMSYFICIFGTSLAFIPFYSMGGSHFVWICAFMSVLILFSLIKAKSGLALYKSTQSLQ